MFGDRLQFQVVESDAVALLAEMMHIEAFRDLPVGSRVDVSMRKLTALGRADATIPLRADVPVPDVTRSGVPAILLVR